MTAEETEKDPPGGLTPKEQRQLEYQRKLDDKLIGKGWFRRQGIMCVEGLKFWRWGVKELAIWTASGNFTLGQVAAGGWVKANWTLIVLPFLKGLGVSTVIFMKSLLTSIGLAIKSAFFAVLTALGLVIP